MSITYNEKSRSFKLRANNTDYMFKVINGEYLGHVYYGKKVPDVLTSGHHANILKWQHEQSLERTLLRRPDMLEKAGLSFDRVRIHLNAAAPAFWLISSAD